MAPESEEAIEKELDEMLVGFGTDDEKGDDEETSSTDLSSIANQTPSGNSSSPSTGSLFGDLLGK